MTTISAILRKPLFTFPSTHDECRRKNLEDIRSLRDTFNTTIDKAHKIHNVVKNREQVLAAITKSAPEFLRSDSSNGGKIYRLLKGIGESLNLDRAWYIDVEKRKNKHSVLVGSKGMHLWQKDDESVRNKDVVLNKLGDFVAEDYSSLKEVTHLLYMKQVVILKADDISDIFLKDMLKEAGITTVIVAPVLNTVDEICGVIGFTEYENPHEWVEEEISAIMLAADMIAAWKDKVEKNRKLKFAKEKIEQMVDICPVAISTFEVPSGKIEYFNKYACETLGIPDDLYKAIVGKYSLYDFLKTKEEKAEQDQHMQDLLDGKDIMPHIHRTTKLDGSGEEISIIVHTAPFWFEGKVVAGVTCAYLVKE